MTGRAWDNESLRETDERFPSCRWAGYWQQGTRRGRMQLDLTFGAGRVFGDGRDGIGDFVISGSYDCGSGRCSILKAYLAQHGVDYDGAAGPTGIRGTWKITDPQTGQASDSGPFHIWPTGADDGVHLRTEAQIPVTV